MTETERLNMSIGGYVGEILVWESEVKTSTSDCKSKDDEIIFEAKGFTPDEDHPHHTPRYWDGQVYYLAENCRLASDEEISYFEDVKQKYGNVTAISYGHDD